MFLFETFLVLENEWTEFMESWFSWELLYDAQYKSRNLQFLVFVFSMSDTRFWTLVEIEFRVSKNNTHKEYLLFPHLECHIGT